MLTDNLFDLPRPENPLNMRYFIYARKSSESDERQIQSIPDQQRVLQPIIDNRQLTIAQPLEESKSAKIPGRPVFNQMVKDIEQGKANGIIVWDASRLSRNSVDTGRLIYLMDQGKLAEIVTPTQTFRNTPNDKFLLSLLCSVAKKENDDKSLNVKRALQSKAERGDPIGPPRVGYRTTLDSIQGRRKHEPDPIHFPLFKSLLKMYLTGRCTVMDLVREGERLGIRNYKGKPVTKTCMYRLLQDPYYLGMSRYKGKVYPGNHIPMINQPEFDLIQDILNSRSKPRPQTHEFDLGGGLIKCGECGYHIIGDPHTKKYRNGTTQQFVYYRCSKKGKNKCSQPYIPADKLEKQVIEFLGSLEIPEDFAQLAIECLNDLNEDRSQERQSALKSLQDKVDNAERKLENLLSLYMSPKNADGVIMSIDEFAEVKRRVVLEKDSALKELQQFSQVSDEEIDLTARVFNFAVSLRERYENGDMETRKRIVRAVGSNLIIKDQKLDFQARKPFVFIQEAFNALQGENTWFDIKKGALQSPLLHSSPYGSACGSRTRDSWDENPVS